MPIRKLVPLSYPFEQLHGRCAALAERICYIYVNKFANKDAVVVTGTLLTKQKGRRGRPTLEAKRQSELNPKKTLEQFWKDIHCTLSGRFQLLDKEKPTLLLDTAQNLDVSFFLDYTAPTTSDNSVTSVQAPNYIVTITESDNVDSDPATLYCTDTTGSCIPSIVIDNGGSLEDSEWILGEVESGNVTHYVRNYDNLWFGYARNQGYKLAEGKYIFTTDNDII